MSLVPNQSFANENRPLFVPYTDVSGGGGYPLNPTFETINISNSGNSGGFDVKAIGLNGDITCVSIDNTNASGFATGRLFVFDTGNPITGTGGHAQMLGGNTGMSLSYITGGGSTVPFITTTTSNMTLSNLLTIAGSPVVSGSMTIGTDVSASGNMFAQNITASGTLSGVGPVPTTLITSTKTINPLPVSPTPASAFPVDTNYPTASNQQYDVMARGILAAVGGAPDVDDIVNITLDAGATTGVWTYQFKPSSVGDNGNWEIRDRITSDAAQATIFISAQTLRAGASTADYSATLRQLDVTRVK